jgi:hypothetical protein
MSASELHIADVRVLAALRLHADNYDTSPQQQNACHRIYAFANHEIMVRRATPKPRAAA